jgi:hypothetical protein
VKSIYVSTRLAEIDTAINKAKGAGTDAEIAAFLARYLAVFACGAYEDCIEHLFIEKAKKAGDEEMVSYITSSVHLSFRNPDFATIKEHIKRFDSNHGESLRKLLADDAIQAINSIKTNKDLVAHGQPCSATLNDIEDYHKRAVPVFDAIEGVLGLS